MNEAAAADATARGRQPFRFAPIRRPPLPTLLLLATVAAVAALRLVGLGVVPPGLYVDEASIGYNAWALGHHGVDEHGAVMPLYVEAFGEFKNPLYIYLLAPLTRLLPLTAATIRLPAALCSLAACLLVAATVRTLGAGRAATWLALCTAGVTPWLVLQGRVAFEVATLTPLLALALYGVARAWGPERARGWGWVAGLALGLAVFAYTTARAYVPALAVALVLTELFIAPSVRTVRRLVPVVGPALLGSAVYAAWALTHWGAATGRFSALAVTVDGAAPGTVVLRVVRNLGAYWSVPFLLTRGDAYLRHATGAGGMLLVTTAPALLAGVWLCLRTAREPVSRLLLLAVALGPVPAALTLDDTPHALRAATMLAPLLVIAGRGWMVIVPVLRARPLLAGLAAIALTADAGAFLTDLLLRYPDRTIVGSVVDTASGPRLLRNQFDAGDQEAIRAAHDLARGHTLHLSASLDQVGEEALVALTPDPVGTGDRVSDQAQELRSVGTVVDADANAVVLDARAGDIAVLAGDEPPPPGATQVFAVSWTVSPDHALPSGTGGVTVTLVAVYSLAG